MWIKSFFDREILTELTIGKCKDTDDQEKENNY